MGLVSIIILLVVLVAIGIGGYFTYKKYVHGLPSGEANYLVSFQLNMNLHEITSLDGILNDWKYYPLIINNSRLEKEGNTETSDNLYTKANVMVTVGDFGFPQSINLTTQKREIVLLKEEGKSIVLLCYLGDPYPMSVVYYRISLKGCPNGIRDFSLESLKKFPKTIRFRWYTVNKMAQRIDAYRYPLYENTGTSIDDNTIDIFAEPEKDNVDVDVTMDINLLRK